MRTFERFFGDSPHAGWLNPSAKFNTTESADAADWTVKHISPISCVAAHGECYVATAGYDNQVVLWDACTHQPLARGLHDHLANQCSFSSSGQWLASASSDYSARVWAVPHMRLSSVIMGHDDDVEMVAFSPCESYVATCSRDRTVRISSRNGQPIRVLRGHEDDVLSVVWTADARHVITSSDDGTVRQWSIDSASEVRRIEMEGSQTDTIVVDSYGRIFAGDDSGTLSLFAEGKVLRTQAHDAGIKRLVLNESLGLLASLSYDRTFALWKVDVGNQLRLYARDQLLPDTWARSAAFLGTQRLLFGTFGRSYQEYLIAERRWAVAHIERTYGVNAVAEHDGYRYTVGDAGTVWKDGAVHANLGSLMNFFVPAGGVLLTGGQLGRLFDAVSGRALHQHRSPLNCGTTFRRHGLLHAVIGTYTGEALVLAIDTSGAVTHLETWVLHDNAIKGLAANDEMLFSVCASGAVAFHDIQSGRALAMHERGHSRIANGCAALANGFASVGRDKMLRIWRGLELAQVIDTPHPNSIKCIAIAADGTTIATGGYAGLVALYDSVGRRWLRTERPTAAGISSLFGRRASDGPQFMASSYDGSVYAID